jgi:hypothetical protein
LAMLKRDVRRGGRKHPRIGGVPGHISVHPGRPSPSSSTARIIW